MGAAPCTPRAIPDLWEPEFARCRMGRRPVSGNWSKKESTQAPTLVIGLMQALPPGLCKGPEVVTKAICLSISGVRVPRPHQVL